MQNMLKIGREKQTAAGIAVFTVLLFVWLLINHFGWDSHENRQVWAASYQIIAFYGGILGIIYSRPWGGYKSLVGRAILAISVGLFLQCFGQSAYSYYIFYENIEVPYPSLGDIGFFGSVIMYIYGVILLARVSGVKASTKNAKSKLGVLAIPAVMLLASYHFFLKGVAFDWSSPITTFLNFGYPYGQALYISIALLTLVYCRQFLGGIMKGPVTFLVCALVFQYISDFTFLYQSSREIWLVGGINDLMYATSYLLMTIGIIYIGKTFYQIRES
jgi:hypothetical protein